MQRSPEYRFVCLSVEEWDGCSALNQVVRLRGKTVVSQEGSSSVCDPVSAVAQGSADIGGDMARRRKSCPAAAIARTPISTEFRIGWNPRGKHEPWPGCLTYSSKGRH